MYPNTSWIHLIYIMYWKAHCMYGVLTFVERERERERDATMAHLGISRILTAQGGYPVQGSGLGSLHGDVGFFDRERPSGARRKMRKREKIEQKGASPKAIVVEQWICFVLGFVCMAFGAWGICMRPGQYALSEYIAWLGSLYMPAIRLTAVACFGMGVMLIRQGWSHL
jgi:hypothetical protein